MSLPNLQMLALIDTPIRDYAPLLEMKALSSLHIRPILPRAIRTKLAVRGVNVWDPEAQTQAALAKWQ